jgi:uncharacterized paraquat-inducible protein A
MTEYLNDKISPDEMVAICWLYATVKQTACKCHLFNTDDDRKECVRCTSLRLSRVAWPFTVGFIEGEE